MLEEETKSGKIWNMLESGKIKNKTQRAVIKLVGCPSTTLRLLLKKKSIMHI